MLIGMPTRVFPAADAGRGVCAVRARVRASNRYGKGEWSRTSNIQIAPSQPPALRDIEEIPSSWLDIGALRLVETPL